MLKKFMSRKLGIAIMFVIIAIINADLATAIAPIVMTYLIANGIQGGLTGMGGSVRSVDPSTGMTE